MARKKMTEAEKKAWRAKMVAAKAAKAKAAQGGDAPAKPKKPRKTRKTTAAQPAAEKPAPKKPRKTRKTRKTTAAQPAAEKPAPKKPRRTRKKTTAKPAAEKKTSHARAVGLPSGDSGRYLVLHAGAGKGGVSSIKAFRTQKDAKDYVASLNGGRALVVEVLLTAA